jgi:NADPH:quinone reductase-like Zn-dependent oxidoreductase
MQAMRIHEYGDPSVIRHDDVPRPVPGPGEVLIRVAATSFNPSEVGLRRGLLREIFPLDLPHTLGGEVSGTVLSDGREVVGRVDTGGAAAEYVVAAADTLVDAPKNVSLAYAAALPIAGVTAWQAVFEHAGIVAGHRVLVVGAGGGVGGFAVQLAKHAGAYVLATAGPRSAAAVTAQGADEVLDYTAAPLAEQVSEPVDVLLNLVPREAPRLVRPDGVLVSITVPEGRHFVTRNDPVHLAALVELVDAGVVRIDVAATRPFTDLPAVHRAAEQGQIRGKVLLIPPTTRPTTRPRTGPAARSATRTTTT